MLSLLQRTGRPVNLDSWVPGNLDPKVMMVTPNLFDYKGQATFGSAVPVNIFQSGHFRPLNVNFTKRHPEGINVWASGTKELVEGFADMLVS